MRAKDISFDVNMSRPLQAPITRVDGKGIQGARGEGDFTTRQPLHPGAASSRLSLPVLVQRLMSNCILWGNDNVCWPPSRGTETRRQKTHDLTTLLSPRA